ncbi:hypothetical protein [Buttiauxella gaviniae]|uniref:hypothetical protein n=1 Tax=Buttiauxella gaviniae TaxID=82990 RepID=UPI0007E42438|nr:hypothetical protein [Buttiauxella gaviniae]
MQDEDDRQRKNSLTLQRRLEQVTPALLSEFLYKRGIPVFTCLLCGSEDIGIPECGVIQTGPDGSERKTFVDYIKLEADGPPSSIMQYQYRVICRNCGFTHHIAVWPVLKWVEEGKENAG